MSAVEGCLKAGFLCISFFFRQEKKRTELITGCKNHGETVFTREVRSKVKGQRFIPGHTGCKVTMKIQNRLANEHRWFNRTESESGTDKSNDKCLSLLQGLLE